MKVYALSDLHVDDPQNLDWLVRHCTELDASGDLLIVAGDVSEHLPALAECFELLLGTFAKVVYVPGNHELWTRDVAAKPATTKLDQVLQLCDQLGITREPLNLNHGPDKARIIPLLSWYALPDDPSESVASLYRPGPGRDLGLAVWRDARLVRWPQSVLDDGPSTFMARQNEPLVKSGETNQDGRPTTITVSHFLPRWELIPPPNFNPATARPRIGFNFSRVAGSSLIESQLRSLGSDIHVYGHQHRNRDMVLEGVRYVSNCLGYANERRQRLIDPAGVRIRQVWPA